MATVTVRKKRGSAAQMVCPAAEAAESAVPAAVAPHSL